VSGVVPGTAMESAEDRETYAEKSDDELILLVQGGDRRSFDILVKRYQRRIYFLALRMARDPDAADDLAQETFVKAYFAITSFTIGRRFYTWLYRICMNLSINYLNKSRHAIPASRFDEDEEVLEREAPGPDAADTLISKEKTEEIETAIDSLSAKYKSVLVLRVYEDMSYEDIAGTLGISVGTVMSRLFRARQKLLETLGESEE
jgi:RNA polymerase sigma-70 factor (ECF subfamily)